MPRLQFYGRVLLCQFHTKELFDHNRRRVLEDEDGQKYIRPAITVFTSRKGSLARVAGFRVEILRCSIKKKKSGFIILFSLSFLFPMFFKFIH